MSQVVDRTSTRIPALDGLRALAVVAVLAFHDDRLSGGFLGVDLFFVISGFVVTANLYERFGGHTPRDLTSFWAQRMRRLMPGGLLVIVVVLVVFRFTGDPADWIPARRDAPWAQFFGENWHQISIGTNYWDRFATPSPFEHLWSLAIEEQFYLIWPILVLGLMRLKGATPAIITALAVVASAEVMSILAGSASSTHAYMGTDSRAFSLLIGALLAIPLVRTRVGSIMEQHQRVASGTRFASLVALVVMWVVVDGSEPTLFRGLMQVHSLVSGLLILALMGSDQLMARLLSRSALTYVGRLSYALYLWHWPVDVYMSTERTGLSSWALTSVRLGVTVALSVATYHLVEIPLRYRVAWTRGQRGFGVFAAAMVATCVLWLSIEVPRTTNAVSADAIATFVTSTSSTTPPEQELDPVPVWSDLHLASVYYFGDSIASDVWPAVQAAFTASGVNIESGAFGGVGLVANRDNVNPLGTLAERLDALAPDLLIVQLSVWDAEEPASAQIEALNRLGLLADEHDLEVLIVSFPSLASHRTNPGQTLFELRAKKFAAQSAGRVVYLDQRPALGATFVFDVDGDGIPERKRDGIHVCPTGALLVARWLVDSIHSLVPTFQAVPIESWAYGGWRTDERYDSPPGACALL